MAMGAGWLGVGAVDRIAPPVMLCRGCNSPMEIDHAASKPGEIHYKRCPCGAIGIYSPEDRYREIHRKKVNVVPYDKSPYRGGKLRR
jgi:hypothetical protein